MTYKINNVELLLQPSAGRWLERKLLGVDGYGHPVMGSVRSFEIRWQLSYPVNANQLQQFYELIQTTGTASVDLPEFAAATYGFRTYSGCVLSEPQYNDYFNEHYTDIRLLISNIRTS